MSGDCRISVILPVYNGIPYLIESVSSVLRQSLSNYEFIIVDDNSVDNSLEYLGSLKDPRIILLSNRENKGLFHNLNVLVRHASSPLIKLWSQDDIMLRDCLEKTVAFHQLHPEIGFSFSGRNKIDEWGNFIGKSAHSDIRPVILNCKEHAKIAFYTGSIAGSISNLCFNKRALDEVGPFNESMKISGDFDMLVRIARDHPVGFIPDILVELREHRGQLSVQPEYSLNHVKEDLLVYRNLISYCDTESIKEGKGLMRNYKMIYYYTLMLKSLFGGKIKEAYRFYRALAAFDNFFMLTFGFIRAKIKKPPKPAWA